MTRDIDQIIEDLDTFELEGDYLTRLGKLSDEILASETPERALDAMLALLERHPDEEIGSPGPLIFAIERCEGFEDKLAESVRRRPTTLTIWALYKLIEKNENANYYEALKEASQNEDASEQIREDAALLLSWVIPPSA
jgi:hypothetical protein